MKLLFASVVFSFVVLASPGITDTGSCDISTSFPHIVPGSRCFYRDEVMVGISTLNPLNIYCARLTVTCPKSSEVSETSSEKEK